jgi:hypothetical protein
MTALTASEIATLSKKFGRVATSGDLFRYDKELLRRAQAGALKKIGHGKWEIPGGSVDQQVAFNPEAEKAKIAERFEVLSMLAEGVVSGNIRSIICSGAPGVGKTYTLEKRLAAAKPSGEINDVEFIKGTISPIGLFLKLWENREQGDVLVLDDIDSVFGDEEAMNILKTALDTSKKRCISWIKDSSYLRDNDIPDTFEYQGQIVFLTNLNLDAQVQKGGRMANHMGALLSRACYLDLGIHTPEQILLRIEQVLETTAMAKENKIKDSQVVEITKFMKDNVAALRSVSLRTVLQIASYMQTTADWQKLARATLLLSKW